MIRRWWIYLLLADMAAPLAAQSAAAPDAALREIRATYEPALTGMVNGDGAAWQQMLSTGPDVTLFTPYGGVLTGQEAVRHRYALVAAAMVPGPGRVDVEYLAATVASDLAYLVVIERPRGVLAKGDSVRGDAYTRATNIFRREHGAWKLLHRHMDHLPPDQPPTH